MKKKKRSLPLVAPKHRMVLAADVWLKGRAQTAEAVEVPRSGKTETSSACFAPRTQRPPQGRRAVGEARTK